MDNIREIPSDELRKYINADQEIRKFLSRFPVCKTRRGPGYGRLGMYCPCVLAVLSAMPSCLMIYPIDSIDWNHCSGIWLPFVDRALMFGAKHPSCIARQMQEGLLRKEALPAVVEFML